MSAHPRRFRYWLLQAALALCWIGSWHLGRVLEHSTSSSLWFPPAAMSFALFLAMGVRALPAVAIGVVITNFQWAAMHGDPRGAEAILFTGISFCIAHCLAYGLGAALFDRVHGEDRLGSPLSVLGFLVIATVSSLLAAVAGLGSLAVTGSPGVKLWADLVPWWIGDLVAVVTLAPAFLLIIDPATQAVSLPSSGWAASLRRLGATAMPLRGFVLKLSVTVGLIAAFGALAHISQLGVPVALIVYVVAVPLMWIALTEGGHRTVIAVAVLATALVTLTRLFGLAEQAFNYQAAMIAIAAVGLFNVTVPRLYADNRRLLHLVTYDQLTGASTRTTFLATAEETLERRRRDSAAVSLVLFDIDHFKTINDSFGHAAGDAALARVGEICRRELRGIDLFGRLGGEEFAALFPETERDQATLVAERLRSGLAAEQLDQRRPEIGLTASFGVVQIGPEEPLAQALERADRALYQAKRAGRNRVACA